MSHDAVLYYCVSWLLMNMMLLKCLWLWYLKEHYATIKVSLSSVRSFPEKLKKQMKTWQTPFSGLNFMPAKSEHCPCCLWREVCTITLLTYLSASWVENMHRMSRREHVCPCNMRLGKINWTWSAWSCIITSLQLVCIQFWIENHFKKSACTHTHQHSNNIWQLLYL